jgi:hypothetical protein
MLAAASVTSAVSDGPGDLDRSRLDIIQGKPAFNEVLDPRRSVKGAEDAGSSTSNPLSNDELDDSSPAALDIGVMDIVGNPEVDPLLGGTGSEVAEP